MKTIFLLPCLVFLAVSCHEQQAEETKTPQVRGMISITQAQKKNITLDTAHLVSDEQDLTLTGKVSFDESKVEKVFPLVGGNVLKVAVALGDYVHKGQLLCTIRSTEISDLQSQFTDAQNNLSVAKKNLDIAEELYRTHNYSEVQVITARHDYATADAELKRVTQALAVYGANGTSSDALYNVYSPIDGYVVEKNVNEDMEIRSDNTTNIFTVSALNTVWVLADVYESDLSKIKVGDKVDVTVLAYPGKIFSGKIDQAANLLDPDTKTMKVRIVMDNSDGLLKPEMFAVVKVHISNPGQVVSIPSASIVFDNNRYFVMVRKNDTLFEKREIVTGAKKGDHTTVRSGLNGGEVIVKDGSLLVANNNF